MTLHKDFEQQNVGTVKGSLIMRSLFSFYLGSIGKGDTEWIV